MHARFGKALNSWWLECVRKEYIVFFLQTRLVQCVIPFFQTIGKAKPRNNSDHNGVHDNGEWHGDIPQLRKWLWEI
jgi:hypothetical protein